MTSLINTGMDQVTVTNRYGLSVELRMNNNLLTIHFVAALVFMFDVHYVQFFR